MNFQKLLYYLYEYPFELMFIILLLSFLIYSIYRKCRGFKGTWSKHYYLPSNKFISGEIGIYHKFKYSPNGMRRPSGKRDSKGEVECRRVLEKIFNCSFDKCRPDFLRNDVTGGNYNLEIDCYNPRLRLGIEYNGVQHYKYTPFFHKNKESFYNQKYRDELKRRMCRDNKVVLIEVPYDVKLEKIEGYLIEELRKNGFRV